jgi:hypothetical protein
MQNNSIDKLFEELSIKKVRESCFSPPFGGYAANLYTPWPSFYNRRIINKFIECYYNEKGQYHRIYGPAIINKEFDIELWYKNGQLHREDGPAVKHKNNLIWYIDGLKHRIDGPAVIDLGGPKQYWVSGEKYTLKEYKRKFQVK